MRWLLQLSVFLLAIPAMAQNTAATLATQLREAGLNPDECYRVRELTFVKDELRLFLTEGFLIFGEPVNGRIHSAVFSGEVEGGDAEILLMPPNRSERMSLATFTDSPNLNEHFRFALMIFSDDTAEALAKAVQTQPRVRKSPERGVLLADRWNSTVSSLSRSFGTRLVYDVLSEQPLRNGFFYSVITGSRHGNFDIVFDPTAPESLQIGQIRFRNNRAFFDVWTTFATRSFRNGQRHPVPSGFYMDDYRIEATLDRDLKLSAVTEGTITVEESRRRVLYFDISPRVRITEVSVDGEPCEVWQRDAVRANLFGGGAGLFIVVTPNYLEPGNHAIRFTHEGKVVRDAGNGVYYVGARGSWYPYHGLRFSHFDITFRYPEELDMVFSGTVIEDRTEDEWRITRRKTESPMRLVGFNVGQYEHLKTERDGFAIEVYANENVEEALEPERKLMLVPQRDNIGSGRRRRMPAYVPVPATTSAPDPTQRLEDLAAEVAGAMEFMSAHFGRSPTYTLMVSPIPGSFGQGFPGMLYLSTMAYLRPEDRPADTRDSYQDYFYSEILHAHETAHQWWGNTVTALGYQDGWLMEALANYSAMLLLEKRQGAEALGTVLGQYRDHLLIKNEDGKTLDSAGPIVWGPRLDSSQARASQVITYEKGSWIVHMIRRRLGDERFLEMLGEICREHRYEALTTEDFRTHAAAFVPEDVPDRTLESFFEQWVYDVGIPTLRFQHRVRGQAPRVRITGSITQSGVPGHFTVLVPFEIQLPGGKTIKRWIRTGEEPATFDITVRTRPERVVFNPGNSVLVTRR